MHTDAKDTSCCTLKWWYQPQHWIDQACWPDLESTADGFVMCQFFHHELATSRGAPPLGCNESRSGNIHKGQRCASARSVDASTAMMFEFSVCFTYVSVPGMACVRGAGCRVKMPCVLCRCCCVCGVVLFPPLVLARSAFFVLPPKRRARSAVTIDGGAKQRIAGAGTATARSASSM